MIRVKSTGPFNMSETNRAYRSMFDLSHEKKYTADMGQLIPHLLMECIPGDVLDIGLSSVIRFQPLVAPVLHSVRVKTYYFFVPYRILWDDWEEFITRGTDGESILSIPTWIPDPEDIEEGKLWDYFGFPLVVPPEETCPIDFPRLAYNTVWNEYFRDQNLQDEVALDNVEILRRNWNKDYFTSSLPFQQRGTAPAMPVSAGNVVFDFDPGGSQVGNAHYPGWEEASGTWRDWQLPSGGSSATMDELNAAWSAAANIPNLAAGDVADYRLLIQLQSWMERNARAGVRYTEFLRAHFPAWPRDDRLQRPEFIGGTTDDILFSEVLQTSETSETGTPQGNMAGHAISVQSGKVARTRIQEFGLILGLSVVYPKASYQNGLHRSWLRRTTFDFYFPEFALLSEQEVFNAELCMQDVADDPDGEHNLDVFGFQGRYDELRSIPSQIAAGMRDTYAYWHFGRQFDPESPPALNSDFIVCNPRKDVFAVQDEPGLIVAVGNHIKALRPMPAVAIPAPLFR